MPKHGDPDGTPNWTEARREVYSDLAYLQEQLEKTQADLGAAKAEAARANGRIDIFEAKILTWSVMVGAIVPSVIRLVLDHIFK